MTYLTTEFFTAQTREETRTIHEMRTVLEAHVAYQSHADNRGNARHILARQKRAQRAVQVDREYRMIFMALVGVVLGCFITFSFRSQAMDETHDVKFKYYQNVTLSCDEPLEELAVRYADPAYYESTAAYLDEVVSINHLTIRDGSIEGTTPGSRLIIPYYASEFIQ